MKTPKSAREALAVESHPEIVAEEPIRFDDLFVERGLMGQNFREPRIVERDVFVLRLKLLADFDGAFPGLAFSKKVENAEVQCLRNPNINSQSWAALDRAHLLSRKLGLLWQIQVRHRFDNLVGIPFVQVGVQLHGQTTR